MLRSRDEYRCRAKCGIAAVLLADIISVQCLNPLSMAGFAPSRCVWSGGAGIARVERKRSAIASFRAHGGAQQEGLPSQAIWSSRRGLLARASSASIASVLLHTTGASALQTKSVDNEMEWMAKPDIAYEKARVQLAREAEAAALLITPDVREAYMRDGVAVVRGVVKSHWIESLRQGCEVAQVRECTSV